MTKTQTLLGWIYLPLHALILPLLLSLYAAVSPAGADGVTENLIYFGAGVLFVLCVMLSFLRDGFDRFLDRAGFCLFTILAALLLCYVLNMLVSTLLLLLDGDAVNPNNEAVMELAETHWGAVKALSIFIGPPVEETLFRGVAFGSVRPRSRLLAYAVSAALFSLFHVWQYVVLYADPRLLLYAIQYLPASLMLCWCYERTESIWTPIFFHMIFNALAFTALSAL